jgi:hypothetical protein
MSSRSLGKIANVPNNGCDHRAATVVLQFEKTRLRRSVCIAWFAIMNPQQVAGMGVTIISAEDVARELRAHEDALVASIRESLSGVCERALADALSRVNLAVAKQMTSSDSQ